MKTINATIYQDLGLRSLSSRAHFSAIAVSMRNILALSASVLAAITIITLFMWAAGMEIGMYVGASVWGIGFIFLGLAIDNDGRAALIQSINGVALLALAILQNSVSTDFLIGSGVLLALWAAIVLFERLSDQV